jgi:UMP-CMP kinase
MPIESTLAIVKPDAFDRADQIVAVLKEAGFVIAEREVIALTKSRAAEFYREHAGRPFFDDLVTLMSSGSAVALVLRREQAVAHCRTVMGPTDPKNARAVAPDSVRAKFGTSVQRNAIHGSDSPAAATREIAFLFPAHAPVHTASKAAKEWLSRSIAPTLTRALTEMCRLMPAEPEQWLGEYLLAAAAASGKGGPSAAATAATAPAPLAAGLVAASTKQDATGPAAPVGPAVPNVYFVLGNAGSGKGSQCAKLVDKYGFAHLSAGDLLRREVASGSTQGRMIAELIREGRIVPGEVTISLLKAAIAKSMDMPGILIDGFPRELKQAGWFERDVSDFKFALFFDCAETELERRLLTRGETSGRTDDNKESIRKRFKTFRETCYPVIQYYEAKGKLHRIDSTQSIDEVFAAVDKLF